MKKLNLLLLAGIFSGLMISCQKEERDSLINNDLIDQEVEIENLLADLDDFSEQIIDNELGLLKSALLPAGVDEESCPVITYYRNSEPKKMIIDFGTGCEGNDGKTRSGKIIVTSSSFENQVSARTRTFENYSVNGWSIEGVITKTVTLNMEDRKRTAVVNEELTMVSEERVAFRTGTMTRVFEPGELFDKTDNRVTSWGEVVTEWQDKGTVVKTITEENPLVFLSACRQIVSGVASVTAGDKSWSIDYGNGNCDNQATITRNGIEKVIQLGRRLN